MLPISPLERCHALVIVLTRQRYDPATRAYAQRRRVEGKTNREIRRCLARYVARQLYRLLETQPALDQHRSVCGNDRLGSRPIRCSAWERSFAGAARPLLG
jgi:hypothetical protein